MPTPKGTQAIMSCSYHNKILHVNLSARNIAVDEPGEAFFRTYLERPV
jgi:hypothetical protein